MLARRTTGKVFTCEQYLRGAIGIAIEDKVRIQAALRMILPRLTGIEVSPVIKQVNTKTGAFD